ncbi:MAG: ParB/RepB/Spo0J family partition protein [Alphaproteobacteria bacterium]|uniref:ParB-like N-terminal domain-containing protein n=1 Tax=viral metagenome TaxID=1070528 RepID=A0A6M3XIX9_9ZZZZ|nr:ParB/RepB/Spo0J family partition protein [Alphaproteobacteria bacterium]MBU2342214.1 ParB/RepB/Spo0J family partition protein [Alphaproteobacteria bacterium]
MTDTVPLNKLVLSPRNVRKTNGEEDIAGLAESIKSKGLLQNLVVSPAAEGKLYEVDAGGRRLRALQLLASRKDLAKNWPVPVKVIAPDAATESSLAENLQKIAMNPADEVEAFATIVEGYEANGMASPGERIANCARRFGVTERYVAQRLALAALAPDILDALRENRITITAATAYASHPEQAEQLKVFKAHEKKAGTYGKHDPREIKDALKGRIYQIDHKLVRYIGLDACRAAGGEIATDLFFEDDERDVVLNPALVDALATEKGESEAQILGQRAGWLDGTLKSVTAGSWTVPKPPKGYDSKWGNPEEIPAEERAEGIALYVINDDAQLEIDKSYHFRAIAQNSDVGKPKRSQAELDAEYQAQRRQAQLRYRAARLAVPKVAGTPLEGRAYWPIEQRWIEPYQEDGEGNVVVALLIKVPINELEQQMAEAERRYELEQKELAEEAALAEASESNEPDSEDLDPDANDAAPDELENAELESAGA